jgi:hypothetical protein
LGLGKVQVVDFSIAAERTTDKGHLGLEKAVFYQAFIKLP